MLSVTAGAFFVLSMFAQDISPQKSGARQRRLLRQHGRAGGDALHARSFVLDDGTTKIEMCVIYCCGVGRDMLDEIKALASTTTGIRSSG